jgi:hypothetical protein
MDKELFIAAHEELVEQYMSDHPESTWQEAYDATGDHVYDRYRGTFADMVDSAKQRAKDAGNWPPRG